MNSERNIIETTSFSRKIDQYLSARKVLKDDFEDLKKDLTKDPEKGDLITGTGGCRKIRLKSSSKVRGVDLGFVILMTRKRKNYS